MLHHMQNQTIALGIVEGRHQRGNAFLVDILKAEDLMRPSTLSAMPYSALLVCGIAWILLFVGSYFRYILYIHLLHKYRKKELTPIDVLTLMATLIQHVTMAFKILFYTLLLYKGWSLDHWTWTLDDGGQYLCFFTKFLLQFEMYYACIGSLGIAMFRILYITRNDLVKYVIGERNLLRLILFGGLFLATIMTSTTFMNDYEKLLMENCNIPANHQILIILDEYTQSGGRPSLYHYFVYPRIANGLIMLLMTFAEISIYFTFFHFLYRHDNNERLRRLLEPHVIRQRNKINAITLFGQFCSFLFELCIWILIIIIMLFGKHSRGLWAVLSILRVIFFTCMTIVEVITSSSLRQKLFIQIRKIKSSLTALN